MKETRQQYAHRILSYIEGMDPLAVQAATAKRLAQLIEVRIAKAPRSE